MKNGNLSAGITAFVIFVIAKAIGNSGIFGNGYYTTIEILITFLIWTILCCTYLIINTLKSDPFKKDNIMRPKD